MGKKWLLWFITPITIFMHRENASEIHARHPPQHRPEVSGPTHWSHLLWRKAREPQRKKTKREERQVDVPTESACWALWGLWQRPQEEICRYSHTSLLQFSRQIHSPWLGDMVDFGIGFVNYPPSQGLWIWLQVYQLLSQPTGNLPSPPERRHGYIIEHCLFFGGIWAMMLGGVQNVAVVEKQ